MPEYKNQHFVPQMLLRNFSLDERSLSSYLLKARRITPPSSIANQCSESYFYGKELVLEKAFGSDERTMGPLLRGRVLSSDGVLSESDIVSLKTFIHFLRNRTRRAVDEAVAFDDADMKLALMAEQRIDPSVLSSVTIRRDGGPASYVAPSVIDLAALVDLELRLLVSESGGFVISDHPVVLYNDFVEHERALRQLPGAIGLMSKGLQYFVPVSPNVTIALFDASTYAYGDGAFRVAVSPTDVQLLNRMQAVNADNCIYAPPGTSKESLDRLADFRARRPLKRGPEKRVASIRVDEEHVLRQTILESPSIRIGRRLSFVRVIETFDYSRYVAQTVPIRDFDLPGYAVYFARSLFETIATREGTSVAPEVEEFLHQMALSMDAL